MRDDAFEEFGRCTLEWQKERGIIYVHNKNTGACLLRIRGLKRRGVGTLMQGTIDLSIQGPDWDKNQLGNPVCDAIITYPIEGE